MNEAITPQQLFDRMPGYLDAAKAGDLNATIQFDLSGPEGGRWYVTIANGRATASVGEAEAPRLTVSASAGDAVKILTGEMEATTAFMTRKLQLKGDMSLALRLQSLFHRPSS